MKKILIIGAKGMLGTDLMNAFEKDNNYEVFGWDKDEIDITKEDMVNEKISKLNPDIVISSAAFTDVDGCEENEGACMEVNGYAVGKLARACSKNNSILVHYSTDYIFDGKKSEGYMEDETKIKPINMYGKSKALGEKEISENTSAYYIIRTSWLYGRNGKNFVDTMLELSKNNDSLKVVNDQHGKPTYTKDLAKRTKEILDNKESYGIYHVTNEDETTWCGFAKEIFRQSGIDIKVSPCDSDEFPRPAKRPEYSSLMNTKLDKMRPWQEGLKDYLNKR